MIAKYPTVSGPDVSNTSSNRKCKMSYVACDFGLVFIQRLLISLSIIFGYNLLLTPDDLPHIFPLHALLRILRNFFFITKGIRKWLAINYNDGIIPSPPFQCGRVSRVSRSTPRESCLDGSSRFASGGSLHKHSPIERRYSEPAGRYDLATALKEHRNRSDGMQPIYRYPDFTNSSDFFGQSSSQSFIFLLNGLAKSFVSFIDDPDEEIDRVMDLASKGIPPKEEITQSGIGESMTTSQLNSVEAESRRRAAKVVESVLEHDEEQRKANSSDGSHELEPLPIPNFDADHSQEGPSTAEIAIEETPTDQNFGKLRISCLTHVKKGVCCHEGETHVHFGNDLNSM